MVALIKVSIVAFVLCLVAAEVASAQSMIGQGVLNYATPIIVTLFIFAVLVALGGSIVNPQAAKIAVYVVVITVVMFFVIKTAPALANAVQN